MKTTNTGKHGEESDFHKLTSATTPFIETLDKLSVELFALKTEHEQEEFRKTSLGIYLTKVQHWVWEIDQTLQDIEMIKDLLLEHSPAMKSKNKHNSGKLIKYHYENLILRVPKIKDLLLILVNAVLAFDLPRKISLERELLKKIKPIYPSFEQIWEHVVAGNQELKPYRNHLAHNGTMKHKDLALLEAHYKYGNQIRKLNKEDKIRLENSMLLLRHELVEKFVSHAETYLENSELFLKMVYIFLGTPFAVKLKEYHELVQQSE